MAGNNALKSALFTGFFRQQKEKESLFAESLLLSPICADQNNSAAITMIRVNAHLGKIFSMDSFIVIFAVLMDSYAIEATRCPRCSSPDHCVKYSHYSRYLIDYYNGTIIGGKVLDITVVKCTSCKHFHSILPDFIVPYSSYSLRFMLAVIKAYINRKDNHETVDDIAERFGISERTVYRWVAKFRKDKAAWLMLMADRETSESDFIHDVAEKENLSGFLHKFFLQTTRSFLQTHANPISTMPVRADQAAKKRKLA